MNSWPEFIFGCEVGVFSWAAFLQFFVGYVDRKNRR